MKLLFALIALTLAFPATALVACEPTPQAPAPTAVASTSVSPSIAAIEASAFKQINDYRISQGLPALQQVPLIADVSRTHSVNMAAKTVPFSHEGFNARVAEIGKQIPYSSAAENVAYNQGYSDPATQAVQGWLKSPGHLQNIRGNFTKAGIGAAVNARGEYYLTHIFIR